MGVGWSTRSQRAAEARQALIDRLECTLRRFGASPRSSEKNRGKEGKSEGLPPPRSTREHLEKNFPNRSTSYHFCLGGIIMYPPECKSANQAKVNTPRLTRYID